MYHIRSDNPQDTISERWQTQKTASGLGKGAWFAASQAAIDIVRDMVDAGDFSCIYQQERHPAAWLGRYIKAAGADGVLLFTIRNRETGEIRSSIKAFWE